MAIVAEKEAFTPVKSREDYEIAIRDRTPLPLLADLANYDPNTFDYCTTNKELPSRHQWIEIFRQSVAGFKKVAERDEAVAAHIRMQKAKEFEDRCSEVFALLDNDPLADLPGLGQGKPCCKRMCYIRDTCLRDAGFWDPYLAIKAAENAKALALLPAVLAELDAVSDDASRFEMAVKGVFAGNIFDLGAPDLAAKYEAGADAGDMFAAAKANLLGRPWVVDDLDALLQRVFAADVPPHKKAIVFVDNAGADFVLGILPFARELLKRGTAVVIAANAVASINDMTVGEARDVLAAAAAKNSVLREKVATGVLRVVNSGNDLPMIDLSEVSRECAAEAEGADLIVLEGMGRGIESNLNAEFKVDSLKLAMVKHREVAQSLRGRMYDCVCRYMPGRG